MSDELETQLGVLARYAVRLSFEVWAEEGWERHLPEIGQYDFEAITDAAEKLLPADVTAGEFEKAFSFFEQRAEQP